MRNRANIFSEKPTRVPERLKRHEHSNRAYLLLFLYIHSRTHARKPSDLMETIAAKPQVGAGVMVTDGIVFSSFVPISVTQCGCFLANMSAKTLNNKEARTNSTNLPMHLLHD